MGISIILKNVYSQVSNSTFFGKSEHYTVTKVTEYFWQFDVK